jgi:phosphohistidine phosphatase SixA
MAPDPKLHMHRVLALAAVALVLGAVSIVGAAAQDTRAEDSGAWALLKKPGHIVLLRHSNAPESPPDADKVDFKNCATQRNLDDAGRAQARRIGNEFRKHGITRVRLVSSQYCRARETAKLTGLGPVQDLPALNQVYLADLGGMKETAKKSRQFMRTILAKQMTMIVSHVSNIQSIAGVVLSSGEMAVVHIDLSGSVAVDGRIKVP